MRKGGKAAKWAARSERLSAALRENLKRRKVQARRRAAAPADESASDEAAAADQSGSVHSRNDNAAGPERKTPDFRRNRSNE